MARTPDNNSSSPPAGGGMRTLMLPVIGVVAIAVAVVAGLVLAAVYSHHHHRVVESQHLARVAMRQIMDDLRSGAQDYTWWDESVRNVVLDLDREWTGHLWGYYQENFRGNDFVMAIGPDDEVIMVWQDGQLRFGGERPALGPDLDLMIDAARATPPFAPAPVTAWLTLDGEVYAVAVGAITPSDPNWANTLTGPRGVGVFARRLEPLLANPLSDDFMLEELAVAAPPVEGERHLDLPGPGGVPIAALVWSVHSQVRGFAGSIMLPVAALILLAVPLVVMIARQTRRLFDEDERLRKSLEREREMGALKSRFVSMVSHELRTPLTAIMASNEMLRHYSERLSEEERRLELDAIESEVDRLARLIDEVITLGKADATGFEFRPQRIDLGEKLAILADRAQIAAAQRHEISVHGADQVASVIADPHLIELAVGNVLGNAVKYSPGNEPVHVAVRRDGDTVEIDVIDRGIGIPGDELASIGEPFYRAANAARVGGTGLGLAIAMRAAEAHGGNLTIESELGRGTKVTITLQLGTQAREDAP